MVADRRTGPRHRRIVAPRPSSSSEGSPIPPIAVLSDLHANRQALDAVKRASRSAGIRTWWCLGDLVGYGADPSYCLAAGREAERCIAGNHDLGASGRIDLDRFASWARTALAWTRDALGAAGRAKLDELEPIDPEGDVHLAHGSPRDPIWEYIVSREQALDALAERRVPLTLVGHTHVPAAWRLGPDGTLTSLTVRPGVTVDVSDGRWLINPGSVGQPRDGDPRAAWAVYDPEAETVTFQRTPYDVAGAQNAILTAGLPEVLATRLAGGV